MQIIKPFVVLNHLLYDLKTLHRFKRRFLSSRERRNSPLPWYSFPRVHKSGLRKQSLCTRGEETAHFPSFPFREYTKTAAERQNAAFAEEETKKQKSSYGRLGVKQLQVSGRIGGKGQRGPTRVAVLRGDGTSEGSGAKG